MTKKLWTILFATMGTLVLAVTLLTTVFLKPILTHLFEKVEASKGYRISVDSARLSVLSAEVSFEGMSVLSLLPEKQVSVSIGAVEARASIPSLFGTDKVIKSLSIKDLSVDYTTRNRTVPISISSLETHDLHLSNRIVDALQNTTIKGAIFSAGIHLKQQDDQPEGPSLFEIKNLQVSELNALLAKPLKTVSSGKISLQTSQTWSPEPEKRLTSLVNVDLKEVGVDLGQDKSTKWIKKIINQSTITFSTDYSYEMVLTADHLKYTPSDDDSPLKERLVSRFKSGLNEAIEQKKAAALDDLSREQSQLKKQAESYIEKEKKSIQKQVDKALKDLSINSQKDAEAFLNKALKDLF